MNNGMNEKICFDIILSILNGSLKTSVRFDRSTDLFLRIFYKIREHIDLLKNDEPINQYNMKDIQDTVDFIKRTLLYNTFDKPFATFIDAWTYLLSNWNNNSIKDVRLDADIKLCLRFAEQGLTIVESTNVLKIIVDRLNNFKSWTPPAFEIAKHFIKYLDDDIEEPEKSKESEEIKEESECKPEEIKEESKKPEKE